jgi:hypothetical protein
MASLLPYQQRDAHNHRLPITSDSIINILQFPLPVQIWLDRGVKQHDLAASPTT